MRTRFVSLWRLRTFIRPYWRQMVFALACTAFGVGAGTVIPLVIMRIVNGPIGHGHRHALLPMAGLVLALGLAEAACMDINDTPRS